MLRAPRPPQSTCPFVTPHLQGESPQCRDGNQNSHEEGDHVVDGRECHTGAGASQTLTHALLPGQSRDKPSGHRGRWDFKAELGEAQELGGSAILTPQQSTFVRYHGWASAVLNTHPELHHWSYVNPWDTSTVISTPTSIRGDECSEGLMSQSDRINQTKRLLTALTNSGWAQAGDGCLLGEECWVGPL